MARNAAVAAIVDGVQHGDTMLALRGCGPGSGLRVVDPRAGTPPAASDPAPTPVVGDGAVAVQSPTPVAVAPVHVLALPGPVEQVLPFGQLQQDGDVFVHRSEQPADPRRHQHDVGGATREPVSTTIRSASPHLSSTAITPGSSVVSLMI
jgi:hypothetical protein